MEELALESEREWIACGLASTFLLLESGEVVARGHNDYGELGLRDCVSRDSFVSVPLPLRVTQVACGNYHTFLLYENGTVATCGENDNGQLGLGSSELTSPRGYVNFKEVPTHLPVVQVACGSRHTFLRFEDGTVAACGANANERLGLVGNDLSSVSSFTAVPTPSPVLQAICGSWTTFLRLEDGSLLACGNSYHGQLGIGQLQSRCPLTRVPTTSAVASVATGIYHSLLLFEDGRIAACGSNLDSNLFVDLPVSREVVQVACGTLHTVVWFRDGSLATCGQGSPRTVVPVPGVSNTTYVACSNTRIVYRSQGGKFASVSTV